MAEQAAAATTPATSGAGTPIDFNALSGAIATAVAAQLKPLQEQITKLSPATPPPAAAANDGKAKPITSEDLLKLLDDRETKRQQQSDLAAGKQRFADEKMKDLPSLYRGQLGNDPAQWAAEEQRIRDQFKADFKLAGGTPPAVGGDATDGAHPGGAIDISKMSAADKMTLGLKQSKAARAPGAVATNTAAAK